MVRGPPNAKKPIDARKSINAELSVYSMTSADAMTSVDAMTSILNSCVRPCKNITLNIRSALRQITVISCVHVVAAVMSLTFLLGPKL